MVDENTPSLDTLIFHVTGACNLKCPHCWQCAQTIAGNKSASKNEVVVPPEVFDDFLSEAQTLGLKGVKFTGGEPMLHPGFRDYVKIVADKGLSIIIETNGTMLDDDMADFLSGLNNLSISISLDGSAANIHDSFRGVPGSFQKTISGIGLLIKRNISPQIITSLHRENITDLESIVRLVRSIGVRSLKINPVQPMGRGDNFEQRGGCLSVPEVIAFAEQFYERWADEFTEGLVLSLPLAFRPFKVIRDQQFAVCRIHNILGLMHNGDLSFCGVGTIDSSLIIGTLFERRLTELWCHSPLLKALRRGLPHQLKGVCALCILKTVCQGECRALAYERTHDLMGPYWLCQEAYEAGLFPESRLLTSKAERQINDVT